MLVGDARELDQLGLESETVDCIITSPPYWHLKKYGADDPREIGQGQSWDEYLSDMRTVLEQCLRVTTPTGVMWLIADTLREPVKRTGRGELIPLPFELGALAKEVGWRMQEVVIWRKNKTLPYSGEGKLRNLIEYILFFTKSREFKHRPYRCAERHMPGSEWLAGWPERYHPLGKRPDNCWTFDIDTQGIWQHTERLHYCPFPQELVARMIDLTTDKGDTVLDPFAGIGTVPAQAIAMGRCGVGVELNPSSVQTFQDRVLPEFQADWEAGSEVRRLAREDQFHEALTIFQLRLLKAGKELQRLLGRWAQARAASHPAGSVESVVVLEPDNLAGQIQIDSGEVGRPVVTLVVVADLSADGRRQLQEEISEALSEPPFTTFGLELKVRFEKPAAAVEQVRLGEVLEFGQSRHGAFTEALDPRLPSQLPSLLTTVRLTAPIRGDKRTRLDEARDQAERSLLEAELRTGASHAEIALRLGVPQAKLLRMLEKHDLVAKPRSFAISLPGQLSMTE